MIINSSKGTSIDGALRYVEGPGRDGQAPDRSTLLGGGGFGFEPNESTLDIAKRLMIQNGSREFQGEKDRYCDKDCLHLSASWPPDQAPPDLEEKLDTARRALKALGMENSMHLIYDHSDKDHPHIHVIGSRLNPETGRAYDDYKRVEKLIKFGLDKEREDAISGRRPIPEAKRHLHEELEREREIEIDPENRLEAIRKLYRSHKKELDDRYSSKRAIDGLYKAHEKERQMVDDGTGGRWAKEVPDAPKPQEKDFNWVKDLADTWLKHHEERIEQERYAAKEKELEKEVRQDNAPWIKRLTDVWSKNQEQAQEQEPGRLQKEKDRYWDQHGRWPENVEEYTKQKAQEPKRSITDRIIDRADQATGRDMELEERLPGSMKIVDRLMNSETMNKGRDLIDRALGGEVKESEKTQESPREPKLRFDDAIDRAIGAVDRSMSKALKKEERELER